MGLSGFLDAYSKAQEPELGLLIRGSFSPAQERVPRSRFSVFYGHHVRSFDRTLVLSGKLEPPLVELNFSPEVFFPTEGGNVVSRFPEELWRRMQRKRKGEKEMEEREGRKKEE